MGFISSYFRSMKNLPKEDKHIKEEGACTSYSHREGDREMSRKKTPSSEGESGDKLTKILPKSIHNIHEYFKKIRRDMYEEYPRGFESKENSRLTYEESEQAVTHPNTQCSHMPRIAGRVTERGEEVSRMETLSNFLKEYEFQTQKF